MHTSECRLQDMDLPYWVHLFIIYLILGIKRVTVASNNKAGVLFAINVLSNNFFDNDKDKAAYIATNEEYFSEHSDETKENMDNKEGMHIFYAIT